MPLLIADSVPEFELFGTHALVALRRACEQSIEGDREHAVFYRLIGDHVDRLIDDYHQVPLATSKAAEDFRQLKEIIAIAEEAMSKPPASQFLAANKIAAKEYY